MNESHNQRGMTCVFIFKNRAVPFPALDSILLMFPIEYTLCILLNLHFIFLSIASSCFFFLSFSHFIFRHLFLAFCRHIVIGMGVIFICCTYQFTSTLFHIIPLKYLSNFPSCCAIPLSISKRHWKVSNGLLDFLR